MPQVGEQEKGRRINLRVTTDLAKLIDKKASKVHLSVSAWVRIALEKAVNRKGKYG
jgi:uncharacterized protein (DUF1778 family)